MTLTRQPPAGTRRRRRGLVVAGWSLGAVVAAGLLLARDPNVPGAYGFCPLRALTGLDCPLCGGLRGTHALLQGDVAAALDFNLLLPLYLTAGLVLVLTAAGGRSATDFKGARWVWGTVIIAALAFGVLRNLPWFPWLGSAS